MHSSHGSVATHLMCGKIFIDKIIANLFSPDSESETMLKIS